MTWPPELTAPQPPWPQIRHPGAQKNISSITVESSNLSCLNVVEQHTIISMKAANLQQHNNMGAWQHKKITGDNSRCCLYDIELHASQKPPQQQITHNNKTSYENKNIGDNMRYQQVLSPWQWMKNKNLDCFSWKSVMGYFDYCQDLFGNLVNDTWIIETWCLCLLMLISWHLSPCTPLPWRHMLRVVHCFRLCISQSFLPPCALSHPDPAHCCAMFFLIEHRSSLQITTHAEGWTLFQQFLQFFLAPCALSHPDLATATK